MTAAKQTHIHTSSHVNHIHTRTRTHSHLCIIQKAAKIGTNNYERQVSSSTGRYIHTYIHINTCMYECMCVCRLTAFCTRSQVVRRLQRSACFFMWSQSTLVVTCRLFYTMLRESIFIFIFFSL